MRWDPKPREFTCGGRRYRIATTTATQKGMSFVCMRFFHSILSLDAGNGHIIYYFFSSPGFFFAVLVVFMVALNSSGVCFLFLSSFGRCVIFFVRCCSRPNNMCAYMCLCIPRLNFRWRMLRWTNVNVRYKYKYIHKNVRQRTVYSIYHIGILCIRGGYLYFISGKFMGLRWAKVVGIFRGFNTLLLLNV